MLSPFGLGLSLSPFGGGGASSPYITDSNLFVWRFDDGYRVLNGGDISSAPEITRGASHAWEQTTAANQPVAVTDGAQFVTGGSEWFDLASGALPLNASTGIYTAILFKLDAAATGPFQLIKFYDAVSAARAGRYRITLANSASKTPETFIDLTDGNVSTKRITPTTTISKNVWYLLEHYHDFSSGASPAAEYKEDQVVKADNLANAFATTSYPSTNSLGGILGPNIEAIVKAVAVFDGIIPANVQSSISDYFQGIHP